MNWVATNFIYNHVKGAQAKTVFSTSFHDNLVRNFFYFHGVLKIIMCTKMCCSHVKEL